MFEWPGGTLAKNYVAPLVLFSDLRLALTVCAKKNAPSGGVTGFPPFRIAMVRDAMGPVGFFVFASSDSIVVKY